MVACGILVGGSPASWLRDDVKCADVSNVASDVEPLQLVDLLGPFATFFGGIAVAWLASFWKQRSDHQLEIRQASIERYWESVTVVLEARSAFDDITTFGGRGGEDAEADARAASGIERFLLLRARMREIAIWLRMLASPAVVEAYGRFEPRMMKYMEEIGRQMATDGIFRAAAAQDFTRDLEALVDQYVDTLRADLRLTALSRRDESAMSPYVLAVSGSRIERVVERVLVSPPPRPSSRVLDRSRRRRVFRGAHKVGAGRTRAAGHRRQETH